MPIPRQWVTTAFTFDGHRIAANRGVVRGITVRSRSALGNWVAGWQSWFGGRIGAYVHLAETARQEAYDHMCEHAAGLGANAIIAMHYDANDIADGVTEVLAYGTAVRIQPVQG